MKASNIFGLGAAAGFGAAFLLPPPPRFKLENKNVLITGGSRGLGLLLAREFSRRGANVAITARDEDALARVREEFASTGIKLLTIAADMTIREEVYAAAEKVRREFGSIDVLVNNAGTICVGPMESMTIDDYRTSLNTHFWGPYFATLAVLPEMQRKRQGRIVNISSIGGKISVPHLLPYSVGKFALTGFSEGLRSATMKDKVYVTTVCPGLMRTGSPRNAFFKGDNEAEYAWFSISDSLPVLSMNAERAARQVVNACVRGDAEVVLSLPAKLAVQLHGVFPSLTAALSGLANSMLPDVPGADTTKDRAKEPKTGQESFSDVSPSWVTTLNERAAQHNNQIP